MDVICIGTAVLDILASPVGDSRNWKEKQRISEIRLSQGGDACNQSIRLSDAGVPTALAACVGQDTNADALRHFLEERNVDVSHLEVTGNAATGTALILVDEEGERRTFSVKGAHSLLSREGCSWVLQENPKAISIASLFCLPELEEDGLLELLMDAKKRGILTFADLGSDKRGQGIDGIRRFLPYIDYFLPSIYDAKAMAQSRENPEDSGKTEDSRETEDAKEAARFFRGQGCAHVVIKCGKSGVYYLSGQEEGFSEALPVKPVDTTGAGDCFCALFISRILAGCSMKEACAYACRGASLSTLSAGASAVPLSGIDD